MLRGDFAEALVLAHQGDERAFALIYREVQPRLLGYLRVRAPEVADDVSSETWLEVARSIKRFDGDEPSFRAWVLTIARRKLVDRQRYEARRPTVALASVGDLPEAVVADVADLFQRAEDMRAALGLLSTLPPDQADVILLRSLYGLDNVQVARVLGKSPGAVRVLAHRGLRRLMSSLSPATSGEGVST
jgi:RNA polymerase sigma-70 factor (ECF subfamily)